MSKNVHYRIINTKLQRYGITWAQHKSSPQFLIEADESFRHWWIQHHHDSRRIVRWWNVDMQLDYQSFNIRNDALWTNYIEGNKLIMF